METQRESHLQNLETYAVDSFNVDGEESTDSANAKRIHKIKKEKHIKYFLKHLEMLPHHYTSQDQNRITLVYFAIFGLDLLGALDYITPKRRQEIIDWVYSLRVIPSNSSNPPEDEVKHSGFHGGSFMGEKFDPEHGTNGIPAFDCGHLAMTYTALAILRTLGDNLEKLDKKTIAEGLKSTQQDSGCFVAVGLGSESDVRFCFCAASIMMLLFMDGRIQPSTQNDTENEEIFELYEWEQVMDIEKLKKYILATQSYDHAFGNTINGESHGGSTYCAVHALFMVQFYEKLKQKLKSTQSTQLTMKDARDVWKSHVSDFDIPYKSALEMWLIRRQISGFHGRPQKEPDVCYSFWVGSALKTLFNVHHLNDKILESEPQINFTLACDCGNDNVAGGGHGGFKKNLSAGYPDILHSSLGLAGLSLVGFKGEDENGFAIDLEPVFSPLGITHRSAKSFLKFLE